MMLLKDAISDYCSSEQFLFLDAGLKELAEPLLNTWIAHIGCVITQQTIDSSLVHMAQLDASREVRMEMPALLYGFFEYCSTTGAFPEALQWMTWVSLAEKDFGSRFRDDGSFRGDTFKKNYSETGRNEPCFCGSGKKYKKCCMLLNI